jgi:type III pantothenate kinase
MKLIIDIGNSLIKWAVFDNSTIIENNSFKNFNQQIFEELFAAYPINSSILSSVRKPGHEIESFLKGKTELQVLNHDTPLPFNNKYLTPDTLGRDRIAVMAAASFQFPKKNVLVIDAGTSITYDFLNDGNEYLGGGISPGLKMRFEALNKFTDNLPPIIFKGEPLPELIGNNTETSILSGVMIGFIKEIDGIINEYKLRYNNLTIIVTGGDHKYFDKLLKNKTFAAPNFVMEGLKGILDFNG